MLIGTFFRLLFNPSRSLSLGKLFLEILNHILYQTTKSSLTSNGLLIFNRCFTFTSLVKKQLLGHCHKTLIFTYPSFCHPSLCYLLRLTTSMQFLHKLHHILLLCFIFSYSYCHCFISSKGCFSITGLVQFSSVTESCPILCDPMNHSTPGLPVHHQLLEFTQTHVH